MTRESDASVYTSMKNRINACRTAQNACRNSFNNGFSKLSGTA
jgi:hypothetical protein